MTAHQQGFTLVELIIVIVILGIISVSAAPKFIDFQNEAKAASIEQLAATINISVNQVYSKKLIEGLGNTRLAYINIPELGSVAVNYGYPWPNWHMAFNFILSHISQGAMPGTSSLATGSNRDAICVGYDFCLQLYQTSDFRPSSTEDFWGVYFVPEGSSINDACYAFYGLDIVTNKASSRPPVITSITTGC